MPLYLYRWENGDCSIASAVNVAEARERLDEIGETSTDPARYLEVPVEGRDSFVVHLKLTDDGQLALDKLAESTDDLVMRACYPVLGALDREKATDDELAAVVERERKRGSPSGVTH